MSAYKSTKKILQINRDTFWVILVYSGVIALLSLAIPISVQALINVVSFGTLLQPIIVLTTVLFVILSIIACIRIAQAVIVETIQQRIFTDVGIKLADFLPKIKLSNYDEYRVLELVNHFFEVPTIQKALATLLITGIEISLLALFSMILVAFYHPLLLLFDVLLVISLAIALILPWKQALKYSLLECEAKHRFVSWLEEVIHNIILFKMQDHAQYVLRVADNKITDYLQARKKHFSYVLKHIIGINIIYVVANAALLGIGGYLVVNNQLSLGQLVASELIINALLYGVVRFSFYMEDLYDLLASAAKISMLFNIPTEQPKAHKLQLSTNLLVEPTAKPPSIIATNVTYKKIGQKPLFSGLNFKVASGEHLIILGRKNSGKSLLVDFLLGFSDLDEGLITIDGVPFKDFDISKIRRHTAFIRDVELFPGTVYENLVLHRNDISMNEIYRLINQFKLDRTIEVLPDGLNTHIFGKQTSISESELKKIAFIRAILTKPYFLVIDGMLDHLSEEDQNVYLNYLKSYHGTLVITTQNKAIVKYFDNVVEL